MELKSLKVAQPIGELFNDIHISGINSVRSYKRECKLSFGNYLRLL